MIGQPVVITLLCLAFLVGLIAARFIYASLYRKQCEEAKRRLRDAGEQEKNLVLTKLDLERRQLLEHLRQIEEGLGRREHELNSMREKLEREHQEKCQDLRKEREECAKRKTDLHYEKLLYVQKINAEMTERCARERQELLAKYYAARDKLQQDNENIRKDLNRRHAERTKKWQQRMRDTENAQSRFEEEYEKLRQHQSNPAPPSSEPFVLDQTQAMLFAAIEKTNLNFFVQGQAGTGKSTFIQYLKRNSSKRMLVVSPTGMAARNIGGVTIHSLFRLPPSDFFAPCKIPSVSTNTKVVLQNADLLVIDEISMVRPDVFDAIEGMARKARGNEKPFGGLQILVIGDLFQLPPVISKKAKPEFKFHYGHKNAFFFDAYCCRSGKGRFVLFQLETVYRQCDHEMLDNLKNIVRKENLPATLEYFNSARIDDGLVREKAVTITPFNRVAAQINRKKLAEIKEPARLFKAEITGEFDMRDTPAPAQLMLKVGALVIFLRNISAVCINGTVALVKGFSDGGIEVRLVESGRDVYVTRETWKNSQYRYNEITGVIEEVELGSYKQFPLTLGYAMTIHKAQGKTLDKVVIDMDTGAFDHGQLYVALSRARAKSDMHVDRPINPDSVIVNPRIPAVLYGSERLGPQLCFRD